MTTAASCHQCGEPVAENALFCMRCGVEVSGQHGDEATAQMTLDRATSSRFQASMRETLRDATLGEYEILAELGRGGMATVFLGHDISLDRKVAIKVMAPHLLEGEGMVERFKLEARTAAQLSHPHIIPIYAVKETETTLYFVMKFIEGRPLDSIVKKLGPLPIPMVKDILIKVGQALGYAHRREVVHRDIKPGNIMIDEEGTPVVTDFGIAKVAQAQGLTMTGAAIGTPSYMSPEQCSGGKITGASDQYSLGIVAFEMLTGKVPYSGETAVSIMYKHCHEPLPPLEDFRPDCPPELRDTLLRMVAKDPDQRWPSLEAAVQRLGTDAVLAYDDPVRTQMIEVVREGEHRALLAGIKTPRSPVPRMTRRTAARASASGDQPAAGMPRWLWPALAVLAIGVIGAGVAIWPWQSWPAASNGASATPSGSVTEQVAAPSVTEPPFEPRSAADAAPPLEPPTQARAEPAAQPPAGTPPPTSVASVTITGTPARLEPGDVANLSAATFDARRAPLGGRNASWSSSNPGVVRVSAGGVMTAVAPGDATVTATVDGVRGTARITVFPEAVARVVIGNAPGALNVGQTARLTAEPRSAHDAPLTDRPVSWSSSNAGVASVGPDGVVTAHGTGSATITATSEGGSGTTRITVAPDMRTAINDVIQAYARALESRDIDRVRRAYPGITAEQERQLRQALGVMTELKAELGIVGAPQQDGDRASAEVSGTYTYYNASSRRQEQAPVTFRAIFERGAEGWRLIQTR